MEEKIDILLTTYNTKIGYLKEQLDSILGQTYKNFNLIISDDCSTNDDVKMVLKEYEKKDDRIKLYFQDKNLGCTKSFEFLLGKSNAEYIAFSDHDDIWYENKIERCLEVLKQRKMDLVYCDANQIDGKGRIINQSYLKYKNMPIIVDEKYKKILPFSRHIAIGCSQVFTKKVKEKMLPFTDDTFAHDWHSVYIASNLAGVCCVDEPLFGYRIHENNIFGGRSFKQNMKLWKKENGNGFKSYLKYRYKVITETYLAGALMCKGYSDKLDGNKLVDVENRVVKYLERCQNSKILYFSIWKYFKFLGFKGMKKRMFKECMILHFPVASYLVYIVI